MTQTTKVILGIVLGVGIVALGLAALNTTPETTNQPSTYQPTQNSDTQGTATNTPVASKPSKAQKCFAQGGTWSEEYGECTGVSSGACSAIGGTFDECESPCRHNPKAEACIMLCVAVCKL